ncbi:MAG: hypothetical protein LBH70_05565 [Spirochaetaceae bacterium]|jgi:hypothetical protein|nr:hypothetical protein [Spirochaetaceae bacterium]
MKKSIGLHIQQSRSGVFRGCRKTGASLLPAVIRTGCIAILLWFPGGNLSAQQVDAEELRKGQTPPAAFINYVGPYARVDTRQQIWNIGYAPGVLIREGAQSAGGLTRYFVIHSISGPEGDKLDADIFGLGENVGVDHIRNLRLIIQGYLEGAYAYSAQDAALLAEYITVYNAVFRGNWEYITSRYKTPVMRNLERDKAGLSTRFNEWPGRTLLLIPLATGGAGSLSAVDTSSLTAHEVIAEMRKEEGRGIESRREMVDLKEREADAAEQRAALQREAAAQEENRLAREREEAARRREETAWEREAVEREREAAAREWEELRAGEPAGGLTPEESRRLEEELAVREAEADRKTEELDQREAEEDRKEEELNEREEALAEKREEIEQTEQFAEQKAAEARQERQDIAQDQRAAAATAQREPPRTVQEAGVLGIRLISAGSPLGSFVRVDAGTGRELKSSALNSVNVRTVVSVEENIFSIAGENRGNGAIRIVGINLDTLEISVQGEDDIHPQSLLWVYAGKLYALTNTGGSPRLARFSTGLEREAQSNVTVHAYAAPTFHESAVLIQRADGALMVLNGEDLSERQ